MVPLVMLAIMAGCAAFLFFKGTLVHGIIMVFNALIAGFIAFGFFEMLARFLVQQSPGIAAWAPLICFALLFILTFAVLQTGALQVAKGKPDLGKLPEQIGRPVCGVVLGYLLTGYILVAAALAPLPNQYPYPRFSPRSPNPARPAKPVLSPDGFVTGLFATVSKGSLSAIQQPRSFAVLHADYVDQLYLNRHKVADKVGLMTSMHTIDVPRKGVRQAPDSLRDTDGRAPSISPGESLTLVRVELAPRGLRDAGKFTLSQFRLVCGLKSSGKAALTGQGQAVYPLGYIGEKARLERKPLDEVITATTSSSEPVKIDLAFAVPASLTPLVLEFKGNDIAQVSPPAPGEEALEMVAFGTPAQASEAAGQSQTPAPEGTPGTPPPRSDRKSRKAGSKSEERARSLTGTVEEN